VSSPPRLERDEPLLGLSIPGDWDGVCRADPSLAREWQGAVRRAFEALFERGYTAVDCAAGADGLARYTLRRAPGEA
jgi:predicted GNAT superfamily acetyltransferase